MGEGGDGGTKGRGEGLSIIIRDGNMQERSLVIVDGQAGGHFKQMEYMFSGSNCSRRASKEDKSVVGILENGAGVVRENWVLYFSSERVVLNQSTENICNNDEKVWGERVSLA